MLLRTDCVHIYLISQGSLTAYYAKDPTDQLGANITKGEPTMVVWAFGEDDSGFGMDYHGYHRGATMVTW